MFSVKHAGATIILSDSVDFTNLKEFVPELVDLLNPAVHEKWNTTFRVSYPKPNSQVKPTATKKAPVGENEFDNTQREGYRKSTKAGGYQANA